MLLAAEHLEKNYGMKRLIQDASLYLDTGDKVGIIGVNGTGKSTLLRVLARAEEPDSGTVHVFPDVQVSYLPQNPDMDPDATVLEQVFRDLPDTYRAVAEYEARTMLTRLGVPDSGQKIGTLSGGQRKRVALATALIHPADLLILDEPTNHLDMAAVEWLEQYLKNYNRAVVVVSHDRMFLDNVADVVYEIEYGTAKRYPGNYSHFVETKQADYEKQLKDYTLQQQEIKRLETLVERFKNKPTKVAMTRSKKKAIEHMDKIENPMAADGRTFQKSLKPALESGKEVLSVRNLEVGYDVPLARISFELKRGEKIAVVGDNGTGKSTLLKTLVGRLPALGGEFGFGVNVQIGYFDQESAQYASAKDVLTDFREEFPDLTQTEARSALGAFLFTQDDVFRQVKLLSGGEKARLALCKIFQRRPNLLILDEPTNHMDIVGKETLENLLKAYEGTVLFVSHDRYFVRRVADKLLELRAEGAAFYPFGYEQYAEERAKRREESGDQEAAFRILPVRGGESGDRASVPGGSTSAASEGRGGKNYFNPGKEQAKRERRLAKLEEKIAACERWIAGLKEQWASPELAADYVRLNELQQEIDAAEEELEGLMEEYLELT